MKKIARAKESLLLGRREMCSWDYLKRGIIICHALVFLFILLTHWHTYTHTGKWGLTMWFTQTDKRRHIMHTRQMRTPHPHVIHTRRQMRAYIPYTPENEDSWWNSHILTNEDISCTPANEDLPCDSHMLPNDHVNPGSSFIFRL